MRLESVFPGNAFKSSLASKFGGKTLLSTKRFGDITPGHLISSVCFVTSGISMAKNLFSFGEIDSLFDGVKRFAFSASSLILGVLTLQLTKVGMQDKQVLTSSLEALDEVEKHFFFTGITKTLFSRLKQNPLSKYIPILNPDIMDEGENITPEYLKELGLKRIFDPINNRSIVFETDFNSDKSLSINENYEGLDLKFGLRIQYEFIKPDYMLDPENSNITLLSKNSENKPVKRIGFFLSELGKDCNLVQSSVSKYRDNELIEVFPKYLDEEEDEAEEEPCILPMPGTSLESGVV